MRQSAGIIDNLVVEYGGSELYTSLLKAHVAFLVAGVLNLPDNTKTLEDYRNSVATYFFGDDALLIRSVFSKDADSRRHFLDLLILLRDYKDEVGKGILLGVVTSYRDGTEKVIVRNMKKERYFLIQTGRTDGQGDGQEWYFRNYYDSPVSLYAGTITYKQNTVHIVSNSGERNERYFYEVFTGSKDKLIFSLLQHNRFRT